MCMVLSPRSPGSPQCATRTGEHAPFSLQAERELVNGNILPEATKDCLTVVAFSVLRVACGGTWPAC